LVPKEKNSATSAISSAVSAARGSSIMVPTRYFDLHPSASKTSSATGALIASCIFAAPPGGADQRDHDLGEGLAALLDVGAASKIARACIS
jgi:hypothetical protein